MSDSEKRVTVSELIEIVMQRREQPVLDALRALHPSPSGRFGLALMLAARVLVEDESDPSEWVRLVGKSREIIQDAIHLQGIMKLRTILDEAGMGENTTSG